MLSMNADNVWLQMVQQLLTDGESVTPRGMSCVELLHTQTTVDMKYPILTIPQRKLGYKFMPAEAHWILTGDNRVDTIAPYSPAIRQFSDDGVFFAGAYGPRVIDQLSHVVKSLSEDSQSRQAVMTIWRPNLRKTADVPCTVAVQWLIRNGKLHCIDTMRSSDIWLGWPYDIFNFTMLSGYILLLLCEKGLEYELGTITLQAGSQHLYANNVELAEDIVFECTDPTTREPLVDSRQMRPFDPLFQFVRPQQLIDHLAHLKDRIAPYGALFTEVFYGQAES